MSPNSLQAQGASTDETYAIRENSQVPVEGKQQSEAARESIHTVANRDEAQLMSARESTPAQAARGSLDESSDHTTGFARRNLSTHDPIYIVTREIDAR